MINYTHVIWDWNGTLLDDVDWCIRSVNIMLARRGLPTIADIGEYHNVFGFPVIDYYHRIGFDFDKESFDEVAKEFISLYHSDNTYFCLFPEAEDILRHIAGMGMRQIILSASETENLHSQTELLGVAGYFDTILGISDIYAGSKIDIGRAYMARAEIGNAVLIGDTVHDCEVAKALGIDCILVASGHQSRPTLMSCGVPIVDNIQNVMGGVIL